MGKAVNKMLSCVSTVPAEHHSQWLQSSELGILQHSPSSVMVMRIMAPHLTKWPDLGSASSKRSNSVGDFSVLEASIVYSTTNYPSSHHKPTYPDGQYVAYSDTPPVEGPRHSRTFSLPVCFPDTKLLPIVQMSRLQSCCEDRSVEEVTPSTATEPAKVLLIEETSPCQETDPQVMSSTSPVSILLDSIEVELEDERISEAEDVRATESDGENAISELKTTLEDTLSKLKESQLQCCQQEINIDALQQRLKEELRNSARLQREKDDEMNRIEAMLVVLQERLKKEQTELMQLIKEKDERIQEQERHISALLRFSRKMASKLVALKHSCVCTLKKATGNQNYRLENSRIPVIHPNRRIQTGGGGIIKNVGYYTTPCPSSQLPRMNSDRSTLSSALVTDKNRRKEKKPRRISWHEEIAVVRSYDCDSYPGETGSSPYSRRLMVLKSALAAKDKEAPPVNPLPPPVSPADSTVDDAYEDRISQADDDADSTTSSIYIRDCDSGVGSIAGDSFASSDPESPDLSELRKSFTDILECPDSPGSSGDSFTRSESSFWTKPFQREKLKTSASLDEGSDTSSSGGSIVGKFKKQISADSGANYHKAKPKTNNNSAAKYTVGVTNIAKSRYSRHLPISTGNEPHPLMIGLAYRKIPEDSYSSETKNSLSSKQWHASAEQLHYPHQHHHQYKKWWSSQDSINVSESSRESTPVPTAGSPDGTDNGYRFRFQKPLSAVYNRVMCNHRSVTKPKDVKYRKISRVKSRSLEELRGHLRISTHPMLIEEELNTTPYPECEDI